MHRATKDHAAIGDTEADQAERLAYSVPLAAKLIGISARRLWDHVRDKKIKSFREGGRRLISRKALEAYVAERESEEEAA